MAKVSEKLTPVTIRAKAKSGATLFKLTDDKGLYPLVNPNGAWYWRMAYRFGGLQKLLAPRKSIATGQTRDAADGGRLLEFLIFALRFRHGLRFKFFGVTIHAYEYSPASE